MPDKLLYVLNTEVGAVNKIEQLHILTAKLYMSSYKSNHQPRWILQAELNGISLQNAYWNFTTADSPPTSLIQNALAERIAVQIGCRTNEIAFSYLTWYGV
jgi:hypothetical protein